jgi:hypothetical protein
MFRRCLLASMAIALATASCAGDGTSEPEVLLEFTEASPGTIVGLIAVDGPDGRTAEWIHRLDGTIHRVDIDDPAEPETFATIPVGTNGEQRGLLGQTIIDSRRFAAWTQPADSAGDFEIVVGEVSDGGPGDIVWSGGRAGGGAIGGVLGELDGQILLGLGHNTDWNAETEVGGAMLQINPAGPREQEGVALSVGYTNPWAFTVTESGDLWFADNAAGPDPDNPSVDDIERIGRGDLIDDRNDVPRISEPGRAPTAMVELADGRIGICGFLDNELRGYEIVDADADADAGGQVLVRAGTIMPCNLGVAVFNDGTIVTLAQSDTGETLQIFRP